MKIAVPWPSKIESQQRIKESLRLWDDKKCLLVCLANCCHDHFLHEYDTVVLSRTTADLGSNSPRCYILDMLLSVRERFPNEDWYGFGNSDCVPVGNLIEDVDDYESLIFHRTDITDWKDRLSNVDDIQLDRALAESIINMRASGLSDKRVARILNMQGCTPPRNKEWSYDIVRHAVKQQGTVFFWGQDLFLFKRAALDNLIDQYIKPIDPILGTGAFDPPLSKWIMENSNGLRILNRLFHKVHPSEWSTDDPEFQHNGGHAIMRNIGDFCKYYNHEYRIAELPNGYKSAIPSQLKDMLARFNPNLHNRIFVDL